MSGEAALREGLRLFNAEAYFAAHEAWEELWLRADEPLRTYVQGLIQLAAGWHHLGRGNPGGARRLLDAAIRKLEPYPSGFAGIDASEAVTQAQAILGGKPRLAAAPQLRATFDD
ncbi:MAG: DUF309 domain-containing protein [Thermoanaerobaculia bacterium]